MLMLKEDQPALGPHIPLQNSPKLEEKSPQIVTVVADIHGCTTKSTIGQHLQQSDGRGDTSMTFQSGMFGNFKHIPTICYCQDIQTNHPLNLGFSIYIVL